MLLFGLTLQTKDMEAKFARGDLQVLQAHQGKTFTALSLQYSTIPKRCLCACFVFLVGRSLSTGTG